MSNHTRFKRAGRIGAALAVGVGILSVPAAAQAAAVNLGTVSPFVVLGGASVTNTGPSVLNGDLGVSPGTSLVGFGLPAVVNGATHNNDAVASNAKSDLTTAYNVAAGQPVAPADDLTGTNLGNRTLTAGAYRYASSAQLTGTVTLNAEGNPNAQFVFEIGSTLTTAGASAVRLVNGASPCNVYWQVGSSATLGTTTAFQGNLMALTSISLNNGASVIGRLLARNGSVTLINNVLSAPQCATSGTPGDDDSPGDGGSPGGGSPGDGTSPGGGRNGGEAPLTRAQRRARNGRATLRHAPRAACTAGFRARVRGHLIDRVVFRLDGRRIANRANSPFQVLVRARAGNHRIRAHITFRDSTRPKNRVLRYRACSAAALQPLRGPSRFTG
ncbi:MAG: DUF3494 domain-containing protein [Thermoleophilaceae bacterium]|nr:DUF3494 domain-containing protein [Thermoleophilaceae bacterium]